MAIALLVVALLWYFTPPPKPQVTGTITKQQEDELKATIVTLEGQNDSLRQELAKVTQKEIVAQEGFKRAIATLQKENKRLSENPKVVEVRTNVPEVDSLLALKDLLIIRQTDRITEMEQTARTLEGINAQIKENFEQRLANTEQLLADKDAEISELQGDNKRLRRRLTLTKITGVVVLIGIGALAL